MPDYDGEQFSPPAPLARVILRSPGGPKSVSDVAMLIDSGADVTLIPAACAQRLGLRCEAEEGFVLRAFEGSRTPASSVVAEMVLLGRSFRGRFLTIDQDCGVIGRNVLNHLALVLDGPRLQWRVEGP
jgi:hypothetical protein